MKTILVVDDSVTSLKSVEEALSGEYRIVPVTSGRAALQYLGGHRPDMILLDIAMPGMDGFATMHVIQASSELATVPVIFLTGDTDGDVEAVALQFGAVDFLRKPINPQVMKIRLRMHLELNDYRRNMEALVREQIERVEAVQDALVDSFAELAEQRDGESAGHSRRVARYTELLLEVLQKLRVHPGVITSAYIRDVKRASVLHDIGKIGLLEKNPADDEQSEESMEKYLRRHTEYGFYALHTAVQKIGEWSFLKYSEEMAHYHHEHWDGTGFPTGLAGERIPLSARVIAVANAYDYLTSDHKDGRVHSHEKALEVILGERGRQFDPGVVDAFHEEEALFRNARDSFLLDGYVGGENCVYHGGES